jgi:predicted small metal-binding protein
MTVMRYRCLEAGCEFEIEVDSEEELLERVQSHMAQAHDTFELEDVILDNASVVEDPPSAG